MASKLEGNGLFESSRMMLPEHKEALIRFNEELKRRERIELDEQELEQINRALRQSMQFKVSISIRLYDPFERLRVVGVVNNISRLHGQFKVGDDWFSISDIEGIEQEDDEPC